MEKCYLALGGNIGNSFAIINEALLLLKKIPEVYDLSVSRPFCTTPVSDIPQNNFINAVCQIKTNLDIPLLFSKIQEIEIKLGKTSKQKNAPREIDIDLLFYGNTFFNDENLDLEVPHPRWQQRLFVVAPLCDLVDQLTVTNKVGEIKLINLNLLYHKLASLKQESVFPLKQAFELKPELCELRFKL